MKKLIDTIIKVGVSSANKACANLVHEPKRPEKLK